MNHQTNTSEQQSAWQALLALSRVIGNRPSRQGNLADGITTSEIGKKFQDADECTRRLIDLYLPLCPTDRRRFVVAHLGQSLDGRIASVTGASRWITGPEDVAHNHRMRALFDAVVVGAGTVRHDDPQLTVREVDGPSPVRVVLDPDRRLAPDFRLFRDEEVTTLLVCHARHAADGERHGCAEVIGVDGKDGHLAPNAVLDQLERRCLTRIFIEGGGVTVSHFLDAGCLDRLQITVAPVIIGSGRPSICLPEVDRISACPRPPVRHFSLGDDMLFECCFDP